MWALRRAVQETTKALLHMCGICAVDLDSPDSLKRSRHSHTQRPQCLPLPGGAARSAPGGAALYQYPHS